eukprot:CAMPEP_0184682292 /NCGR_PEP_ID=MMETSP0312-20130426/6678_1 /TAXON_ID=31354 /ORGANISM="Compsopogon coeruleus, Strain SAG 36.94" /LENGTH=54 /DNA_ID=CAMNT_0027133863 /DNA_START=68 /DNA_END=229 /DNA_ORIENTATION=+
MAARTLGKRRSSEEDFDLENTEDAPQFKPPRATLCAVLLELAKIRTDLSKMQER